MTNRVRMRIVCQLEREIAARNELVNLGASIEEYRQLLIAELALQYLYSRTARTLGARLRRIR